MLTGTVGDPAEITARRHTIRLAFIAALQGLAPRQRAVLISRDVLGMSASEVGALLDVSVAAVNSALQRARARLPAEQETFIEPSEARQRELLDRYVAAFENADISALIAVLSEDASFEMPPFLTWFRGRDAIGTFLGARMRELGKVSVIRTSANGQAAIALYAGPQQGNAGRTHCMCSPLRRKGFHVWWLFRTSMRHGISICRPAANEGEQTMSAIPTPKRDPSRGRSGFQVFLRVYGVLTLAIFVSLFVGFLAQSPLLAEHGGALNWTIWNDVRCGSEHLHVPPMLMVIYIVWGIFLLLAARDPHGYDVISEFHLVGQPCARAIDGSASVN